MLDGASNSPQRESYWHAGEVAQNSAAGRARGAHRGQIVPSWAICGLGFFFEVELQPPLGIGLFDGPQHQQVKTCEKNDFSAPPVYAGFKKKPAPDGALILRTPAERIVAVSALPNFGKRIPGSAYPAFRSQTRPSAGYSEAPLTLQEIL